MTSIPHDSAPKPTTLPVVCLHSLIRAERVAAALWLLAVAGLNTRENPKSPESPRGVQRPAPTSNTYDADVDNDDAYNADVYKANASSKFFAKRRGPNVVLYTGQAAERDKTCVLVRGGRFSSPSRFPLSAEALSKT